MSFGIGQPGAGMNAILAAAGANVLGGVKIGSGITVQADGTISASAGQNQTPWTQNINAAGYQLQGAGPIGIGTAAPAMPLDIVSATTPQVRITSATTGQAQIRIQAASGLSATLNFFTSDALTSGCAIGCGQPGQAVSSDLVFSTNNSGWVERMRLTNAGNVGIGTTAPAYPLDVTGAARISGGIWSDQNIGLNLYFTGANWIYRNAGCGALLTYSSVDASLWFAASGSAGATATVAKLLAFQSSAAGLNLNALYPLVIGLPAPGTAFENNLQNSSVMMTMPSNTQLVFRARGSDGVIRQATLTLA